MISELDSVAEIMDRQAVAMRPARTADYVLGFAFNHRRNEVVLIRKNKPDWQRGRHNGVGGKIESGETPAAAMQREFFDETGVLLFNWQPVCVLRGNGFAVHVFRAFSGLIDDVASTTDEQVDVFELSDLPETILPNLRWLIPMSLSLDEDRCTSFEIEERYAA